MKNRYGQELSPADITIDTDALGRPIATGPWCKDTTEPPLISISHIEGIGVAMAVEAGVSCGIDIEWISAWNEQIAKITLDLDENLIGSGSLPDPEWQLRIWCAKEAVGKSLGSGLPGGPGDLKTLSLDSQLGMIWLEAGEQLAKDLHLNNSNRTFQAYTVREGELIVATAINKQGDKNDQ
jgi:phosphopantetheinyl transferase